MCLCFIVVSTPSPIPTTSEPTTTKTPKCHVPGWHNINGHEIYLSEVYGYNKSLSWFEADAKSVTIGGYLAEINSQAESDIFNEIKECKFICITIPLNSGCID